MKRTSAVLIILLYVCLCFAADTKSPEWPTYGHDSGGMRFSPLKQVTPANVAQLQKAWVYHMKPAPDVRFAGSASTPLVVNGVMYASTPYGRVVALDIWITTCSPRLPSSTRSRVAEPFLQSQLSIRQGCCFCSIA
jgi:quinoprotein glucose dehydrogenase